MNDFESLDACSIRATGTKKCPKCHVLHSKKGNSYCHPCHNEYQKAYYKKNPNSINKSLRKRRVRNRELIDSYKDVPCMDCGVRYPSFAMDFDHKYDKSFNLSIASNKAYSINKIIEEIKKCDVVCANCHRIRTFLPEQPIL